MYNLVSTNRFRKDVKLLQKRGMDMDLIKSVIKKLEEIGELPSEFSPHKLAGDYSGFWEAHIRPDWLIIWFLVPDNSDIWLSRTGTHSDLF
jgi:mRNA interferase YafQ